jgi:hypothetical protein
LLCRAEAGRKWGGSVGIWLRRVRFESRRSRRRFAPGLKPAQGEWKQEYRCQAQRKGDHDYKSGCLEMPTDIAEVDASR